MPPTKLELDKIVLDVESNRTSIILNHMQPDHTTVYIFPFQRLNRIVQELCTQAHFATLIQHSDRHNVARRPFAYDAWTARAELSGALGPTLAIPAGFVDLGEYVFVFTTFTLDA